MEDRLQKILSAAGVCSRRRAETYIQQGRVTVNGRPGVLGERADPDRDQIALDGVPVGRRGDHQVLMLYKPRGVVTTLSDEKGRPTVADLVRDCGERVWPVGRLDSPGPGSALLSVVIHEGKNRQIRRMCAHCGLTVKRLKRIREGRLLLDRDLRPGQWRPLTQAEVKVLREESFLQE